MVLPEELNLSPERLQEMIIAGKVSHYGETYEWKGKATTPEMESILKKLIDQVPQPYNEVSPQVHFIPLTAIRSLIKEESLPLKLEENMGIVFNYFALKADKTIESAVRNAVLSGVALMKNSDSKILQNSLIEDPRLLFSLVKLINPEPFIRQSNGEPANIFLGEENKVIVIMPNKKLGGDIDRHIWSTPFPEGYTPNSRF